MNKVIFLLTLILFASCTGNEVEKNDNKNVSKKEETKTGEFIYIEELFQRDDFEKKEALLLLQELHLCDNVSTDSTTIYPCSPKRFKFFKFRDDKPLKDAFLLLIRANTILKGQQIPLPVRHILVFEREEGKLVKVNGFRGDLYGMKTASTGIKDLIVRFYVPSEEAFMNCLFVWKDGKYHFKSVEAIEGAGGTGKVKEEFKEELSKQVYTVLMENNLIF